MKIGQKHSQETKEKMRQAKLDNPTRYWKYHTKSKEHIKKFRQSMIKGYASGRIKHWCIGKKRPDASIRMKENNPMQGKSPWNKGLKGYKVPNLQGQTRTKQAKLKMSNSRNRFMKENPELAMEYNLKGALNSRKVLASIMTKPERFVKNILDKCGLQEGLSYQHDKVLRTSNSYKFPDFRLLYKKVIIEADGTYFHKDKIKESIRDFELKQLGYVIHHIPEDLITNNPKEATKQVVAII